MRTQNLVTAMGGLLLAFNSFAVGTPSHPGTGDPSPKGPRPHQKNAIRTVIIDPGHGGFDTGTKGLYSKEAAVALAVSIKLGKALEEEYPDIKQVFTRTTDVMPGGGSTIASGLNYRAELANKSKGDLFIAIHCNNDGHPAGPFYIHRIIGHKYVGKGKEDAASPSTRPSAAATPAKAPNHTSGRPTVAASKVPPSTSAEKAKARSPTARAKPTPTARPSI
ncbi:N-acetylmuramoyl-L-alanine amidase [Puia sp. P3]|uniref:N-acetylmuramoyl-L-alanine amidase family protein n=1 Tax=Puia sp. P3 TaxID=3423952 RepID=UPI003D6696D3